MRAGTPFPIRWTVSKPFKFNSLEVDLEYRYGEHISSSAALVWDSSGAKVSTGVVDYHWLDEQVPPRGRTCLLICRWTRRAGSPA